MKITETKGVPDADQCLLMTKVIKVIRSCTNTLQMVPAKKYLKLALIKLRANPGGEIENILISFYMQKLSELKMLEK